MLAPTQFLSRKIWTTGRFPFRSPVIPDTAFHAAALAHGGLSEGLLGPRPHFGDTYYAAYVRDPDGNKLQAVCYAAP